MSLATDPNTANIQQCPFSGAAPAGEEAPMPDPVAAPGMAPKPALATDPGVFYDPLSYAAYDHPYELYKILRDKAPVYYNERRDLYVVSRYTDVQEGLRNHGQLSSALGNDMDGTHASYGAGNLIMVDAPRHTSLRSAVRRVFVGREILSKEDGIRELARHLITELRANGGGDFAAEVALPLAIGAATKMIGMAVEDSGMLQEHLLRSMVRTVGEFGVPDDAAVSNQEAEEHLADVFGKRSEEVEAGGTATGSDAITQIILGMHAGKVEPDEQVGLAHLILSAAIDAPPPSSPTSWQPSTSSRRSSAALRRTRPPSRPLWRRHSASTPRPEPLPADHRRDHHRRRDHTGRLPGDVPAGLRQPGRKGLPEPGLL
ncbi:putative cytochrome P450 123 [Arthrobacter sp. Hiyo4]|nr:putative cytochrome P450 123 [Arthrobacter sp. Hiyo4]